MLSKKEMEKMIREYDELEAKMKELKAEIDRRENAMKGEMERRNVTELEVGNRVIRYTPYVSQRFDTTGFRKANPEQYAEWIKEVKGHRFSVA